MGFPVIRGSSSFSPTLDLLFDGFCRSLPWFFVGTGAGFGVLESLIWDCGETLGRGDSGDGKAHGTREPRRGSISES